MEIKEQKISKFEFTQDSDCKSYFSDIVEIKIVDDRVRLSFGIKDTDSSKAIVSSYVYMTISHFLKMSSVFNETSKFIEENFDKLVNLKKKQ